MGAELEGGEAEAACFLDATPAAMPAPKAAPTEKTATCMMAEEGIADQSGLQVVDHTK